ncbi:MAG: hypothetical protein R3F21_08000 [Myxococcota bacterium]
MFRRLSEPLPLSEASLLMLRPAMNAPVLNVGFLPVGPARAAVVAFAEEYGGIGIALGIRSNESGQVVVIRNQESIDFDVTLVDALEPLLAEAERMGFLFDEDMLGARPGQRGRSEAMVHWAVLMGGMESLLPTRELEQRPREEAEAAESAGPLSPSLAVAESQYPELILDDVAPLELAEGAQPSPSIEATFEDDFTAASPPAFGADFDDSDLDEDLDDSLEDVLDEVLDEALAGGLGDDLGAELGAGLGRGTDFTDPDPDLAEDPLLSELDLTEPTAPIAAARPAPPQTPPPRAPVVRPAPVPARARPARPQNPPSPPPVAAPAIVPPAAPVPSANIAPAAPAPPAPPPVVLSKFRNAGARPPAGSAARSSEVGADRSAELARIPIVRVRREVEKKVPLLVRLLSSF